MKKKLLSLLVCPECKESLDLTGAKEKKGEIIDGNLVCSKCKASYPIINYIPRFVDSKNYARNFGFEFYVHPKTQLDSFSGIGVSEHRFKFDTGWDEKDMKDNLILEIGCGAGRFSEFPLRAGAELVSIDLSSAVDVCLENIGLNKNHHIIQANIYNLPFKEHSFDRVFCLGVLQHTPDPKKSFESILKYPKKNGGKFAANCYQKTGVYMTQPKYVLRPITKRLPHKFLMKIVKTIAPIAVKFGEKARKTKVPILSKWFIQFIPNFDDYPFTNAQWVDWATLTIFDMLSPWYDQPQTIEEIKEWVKELDLKKAEVLDGVLIRVTL
ncbi:methyltransferase domain-containing protein [Patescibacteria group bacterium]